MTDPDRHGNADMRLAQSNFVQGLICKHAADKPKRVIAFLIDTRTRKKNTNALLLQHIPQMQIYVPHDGQRANGHASHTHVARLSQTVL